MRRASEPLPHDAPLAPLARPAITTAPATFATVLATFAAALATSACSFSGFEHRECSEHVQCRDAFGFGAVCGKSGYCLEGQPPARCRQSYPEDLFSNPQGHRNDIVLASLMDRTSEAHVTRERAVRLAVKGANEAGGIDGRKFALVMCDIREDAVEAPTIDGATRTAAAVASAIHLAGIFGIPALIGPSASTDVEQVWSAVRGNGTLVITPAATSPALAGLERETSDSDPGLLWRMAPSDALQGRVIAEDMLDRDVRRAIVIRERGSYGDGLAEVFVNRFQAGGGTASLLSITSEAEIDKVAGSVASEDAPEVLFVSSQQRWIVAFLRAAATLPAFADKGLFLTDAAANQSVLTDAGTTAAAVFSRVRGTRPAPRDPSEYVLASFIAEFKSEYGADPLSSTFSAHAFDAAWLSLFGAGYASIAEGRVSGPGIARGLRRLWAGQETPIFISSWARVLATFRAGQTMNVTGASGDLDYHPQTRDLTGAIEVWTIGSDAGRFMMVRKHTKTPTN